MRAKKIVWCVFHTTENGADYKVSPGFETYSEASDWEFTNREHFVRPLIIRKVKY